MPDDRSSTNILDVHVSKDFLKDQSSATFIFLAAIYEFGCLSNNQGCICFTTFKDFSLYLLILVVARHTSSALLFTIPWTAGGHKMADHAAPSLECRKKSTQRMILVDDP